MPPVRTASGRYGRVVPISSDQGDPAATSTTAATLGATPTDDGGGQGSGTEPLSSATTLADTAPSHSGASTTVGTGTGTTGTGTGTGTSTTAGSATTDTTGGGSSTHTTGMPPTPVEEGEEEGAKEDGKDTHYVGFEGDQSRVVVINHLRNHPRKRRAAIDPQADALVKEVGERVLTKPSLDHGRIAGGGGSRGDHQHC